MGGILKYIYCESPFYKDIDHLCSHIDPKSKIIYLVNPNNPTGNLYTQEEIEQLLKNFPIHSSYLMKLILNFVIMLLV